MKKKKEPYVSTAEPVVSLNETYYPFVPMYKTKQNHSDYHVDLSTTYSLVAMYLIDKGVASTRAEVIAKTVNQAFNSVVALDSNNSRLVFDLMPELFKMAKLYIDVYGEEGFYFEQFLNGENK